jgi:outer membrane protein assembly factor BamB
VLEHDERRISRRQFIPLAAGGVAAVGVAGLVGYELHSSNSHPAAAPRPHPTAPPPTAGRTQSFITRPDLQPPTVTVTSATGAASSPRFIFLVARNYGPAEGVQEDLMIVDRQGRLVWFHPASPRVGAFDLNAQTYNGQAVLSWWQGAVESAHGYGVAELAGNDYGTSRTVRAGDGLQVDLHELQLTPRGTALVTAYGRTVADISALGGSTSANVFAGHAQEIDIATGKLLFDWNSLDHIGIHESYQPPPHPGSTYDYFHVNSVSDTDDGNLLIGARSTSALYKVDRSTGRVLWRLGGKLSDFTVDQAARFYWQHHSRMHGSDQITLFDNAVGKEKQSRGVLLALDNRAMHVRLDRAYLHPSGSDAGTEGSVELLPDGRAFVGWGTQPYFSEFAPDGSLLLDGQLPSGVGSYRTDTQDWIGRPTNSPAIAARANPSR